MTSIRMTVWLAEHLAGQITKKVFGPREQLAQARLTAAADAVYTAILGEHLPIMKKLPESFFGMCTDFRVYDQSENKRYGRHVEYMKLSKPMPVPQWVYADLTTTEIKVLREARNAEQDLRKERDAYYRSVKGRIQAHSTVKRLLETFPEVEPFLPGEAQPLANPPAVRFDDVIRDLKDSVDENVEQTVKAN